MSDSERLDLGKFFRESRELRFRERIDHASPVLADMLGADDSPYLRVLASPNEREVEVVDRRDGKPRRMIQFGSNCYLGITNHPHVRERVDAALRDFGVGLAGSAIVCGYTRLHAELEERISAFKHAEATMLFPTGYQANVGAVNGLVNAGDVVLYDEHCHASFCDGLAMAGVPAMRFLHNDVDDFKSLLADEGGKPDRDVFVGVEGVYSMDGDLSPLDELVPLCNDSGAILIVDDAHGTGVMGPNGGGTAEHFGVDVDVAVTTFSKALGVVGASISASKPIIDCLRYFARSYVFSTALPPMLVAAALAGFEIIEREPDRITRLRDNVRYAIDRLGAVGIPVEAPAAILMLHAPRGMDVRRAARTFADHGIFIGVIQYPAVALHAQRFRVGMMATHTRDDIDRLVAAAEQVWADHRGE